MRLSFLFVLLFSVNAAIAAHPLAAPKRTSLTNSSVKYKTAKKHYVVLSRGPVRAVIVDNQAVKEGPVSQHRAGYNGVASLTHKSQPSSPFVPFYAGLNYEHIHDGTLSVNKEKFEPRRFPMELRVIDKHTVEVYQPPTGNWRLESCGRYQLLADGTLEYTFECIPRAKTFKQGYIGLFWASYIHAPKDKAIYFRGSKPNEKTQWQRAYSTRHGLEATHPPQGKLPSLNVDPRFPLTLVNHLSPIRYKSPWYYGRRKQMALSFVFRQRDRVWFAKSPTGGGSKNPAWDFQWFVPDYKVGEAYGMVMRLVYVPWSDRAALQKAVAPHLDALNK